jgi:hypothetical protein
MPQQVPVQVRLLKPCLGQMGKMVRHQLGRWFLGPEQTPQG